MNNQTGWYYWQDNCLILNCRVQPRGGKDSFGETMGDQIKVRITAPPVDGKANAHLIKFLAHEFSVPQQNVRIIRGESSRQKQISILNPGRLPAIDGLNA